MGNIKFLACGSLFVVALLLCLTFETAAKIVLTPKSLTVAGNFGVRSDRDGYPGGSIIANPIGMCPFGSLETKDMLVIASVKRFRVLNGSNYLRTWFGKDLDVGDKPNTDGPISDAHLSNPKDCVRFIDPISPENWITYYVTNDEFVRWVSNNVVHSQDVGNKDHLAGIAIHNYYIYAIDLVKQSMIRCSISYENAAPTGCTVTNLSGLPKDISSGRDIIATNNGIFIAFGNGLNWYDNDGKLLSSTIELPICSVSHDPHSNTIWVSTSSAVYNMSVDPLNSHSMRFDLFAGKENASCLSSDNKDGVNPEFCGISRLYAKSPNEIYLSFYKYDVVRAVVLSPRVVQIQFQRIPFPINMTGAETDLRKLYDSLDSIINYRLKTNDIRVNRTSGVVFSNWTTILNLNIQQREFDNESTESEIQRMTFPAVISMLDKYYNSVNQVVYSDTILLPVCSTSKMNTIEHAIADHARKVLDYQLIYTDPFRIVTTDATRNIILVKLLMPASFENQTTQNLLSHAQFTELLLKVMQNIYPSDHKYTVKLPNEDYNFTKLPLYMDQQARLMVRDIIEDQLSQCESQPPRVNDNKPPVSPQQSSCVPRVCISNRTLVPVIGYHSGVNEFEIFIPEIKDYKFSIAKCLDETNWNELRFWINNITILESHSQCGTKCIVVIAVVAAVFVVIIITLAVVLVSKRRRLATVLVPSVPNALNKDVRFK